MSDLDKLCLECPLFDCHKGSRSCLIKKAEMKTKQYWIQRYDGRGRKYAETRNRISGAKMRRNAA